MSPCLADIDGIDVIAICASNANSFESHQVSADKAGLRGVINYGSRDTFTIANTAGVAFATAIPDEYCGASLTLEWRIASRKQAIVPGFFGRAFDGAKPIRVRASAQLLKQCREFRLLG